VIALGAALAALTVGVALALWLVIGIHNITPSTFNTSQSQTGSVVAYQIGAPTPCEGITVPMTANIWPAQTAADQGTVAVGRFCLSNDSPAPVVNVTYALTSTNTNVLAAGLTARVVSCGYFTTTMPVCPASILNADGTAIALTGDDVQAYLGPLQGLAVGNPAQGSQAGDRPMNKTTQGRELIMVSVVLPTSAPISLSGLSNDFSLSIHASP